MNNIEVNNMPQNEERSDRINFILSEICKNDVVLDVGCVQHTYEKTKRDTWLHKYIVNKAKYTVGIDIEKEGLRRLKDEGYNVKFGNAENFNFDFKFDVIVAGELLEHISNPGCFLESVKSNLTSSGKLILSVPNTFSFDRFRRILFHKNITENPQHVINFSEFTITNLLQRHGFEIIKIKRTNQNSCGGAPNLFVNFFHKVGFKHIGTKTLVIIAGIDNSESSIRK